MALNQLWKTEPSGCLTSKIGLVRMLVEPVGASFRVVVTRSPNDLHPDEVLASASASDARAAISMAERMAARLAS